LFSSALYSGTGAGEEAGGWARGDVGRAGGGGPNLGGRSESSGGRMERDTSRSDQKKQQGMGVLKTRHGDL